MKRYLFAVIFFLACFLATLPTEAQTPVAKRLIAAGTDSPTGGQFQRDARSLDALPFDGTGIELEAFGVSNGVNDCPLRGAFGGQRWERKWFGKGLESLRNAKSKKKAESFIFIRANPGNVDWFDDAGWTEIVDHWRIAARIAKESGVRG